jgi:hypothetical protein
MLMRTFTDHRRQDMTPAHCNGDRRGDLESDTGKIATTRRAADHHYLAVVAAEIHRLALQMRSTRRAPPDLGRLPWGS